MKDNFSSNKTEDAADAKSAAHQKLIVHGCSGHTRVIHQPLNQINCTVRTSIKAKPAFRSPSICRRRQDMTAIDPLARGEVGKVGVPIST